jgi:hypothetical protein
MMTCNKINIVRFQVLMAASMNFRVFWDVIALMMGAICTSEMSVNINLTTWCYIPEDSKLQDKCSLVSRHQNKITIPGVTSLFSQKVSHLSRLLPSPPPHIHYLYFNTLLLISFNPSTSIIQNFNLCDKYI